MRKNSKSSRKSLSPTKKTKSKMKQCLKCSKKIMNPLSIQSSLYNKYSSTQIKYHHVFMIDSLVKCNQLLQRQQTKQTREQHLAKYHKKLSVKHTFSSIKQVYKQHKQIPRIFDSGAKQIFNKCHHRKRLLQYFKIAKILGIKVQSIRFSTFLLSKNQTKKNYSKSFQPIISAISRYQFSQEIQKKLLQQLQKKQNNSYLSNQKDSSKNQFSTFFM